ncbi:MAG: GldG family protein [Chloroflexi bacterium]|nr:GldG family protein [Chloroflexota bacterium]
MRARLQSRAELFGGIGLALWAVAFIFFLIGNQPGERLWGIVLIGVVFIALFIYARPTQVEAMLSGRSARYGSNALITVLALIGIIALVNVLSTRYHWRQDFTQDQSFTLSPKTLSVLKDLKQPVQAVAFYPTLQGGGNRGPVEDRLKEYANLSDKFTYKFIDPDEEPAIAREYKAFSNMIVFERGTRRENVFGSDEQAFTNALVKVSQDTQPTIYFTLGHGEHSPNDNSENGYSLLKSSMETNNYKVDVLDLRTVTETMPSEISALVIAGATKKFDAAEIAVVKKYLDQSGRVMILLDPQTEAGLDALLKEWGLEARNDIAIDQKYGFFGRAQIPVIVQYKSHQITSDLAGETAVLPGVRSLTTTATPPTGRNASALFSTSDQSWGETDFVALKNQQANFDANKDTKGPVDLAYAVEASGADKPARLVVFGNSTFPTNGTFNTLINVGAGSGNEILFSNSLAWLAGQDTLISIPTKQDTRRPVILTSEQSNFVFWSSFLFLPAALLIVGAIVWWRRR